MQKLFNLLFDENSVILFYRNNFSIYLIILSGLDTLVLGLIRDFCSVTMIDWFIDRIVFYALWVWTIFQPYNGGLVTMSVLYHFFITHQTFIICNFMKLSRVIRFLVRLNNH